MASFMLIVLVATSLGPFLSEIGFPSIIGYTPELAAMAACTIIVARVASREFGQIRIAILLFLGLLSLHLAFGLIANGVQAGTLIVGARLYFRAFPFFILALLIVPKPEDLKKQFFLIMGLSLIQAPIAIYQKLSRSLRGRRFS